MKRFSPWFLIAAVGMMSCAQTTRIKQEKQFNPTTPAGAPLIRSANGAGEKTEGGTPVAPGGNAKPDPVKLGLTPESDIVFTNPDDPEANLPELSTILTAPTKRKGPWEDSETAARQRAAREGKPMLIWFTDSARSPMCKALTQELFTRPEFEQWASEKLVRLRVDANVRENDYVKDPDISIEEEKTREIDVAAYVARMKKTYKVLGYPSLYLLNPSGEVIGRYRGYKRGDADYTWGLLKQGEAVSANAYKEWRTKLEKKGYREWADRKDRKVFARLTGYSNGTLVLIEPDGTRCRTHESKLSDADRAWIADQKKLRDLH